MGRRRKGISEGETEEAVFDGSDLFYEPEGSLLCIDVNFLVLIDLLP